MQPDPKALKRLELLIRVRAGLMSATEAAAELGVSRQCWHEWENRGLEAALEALGDRPTGRPSAPEPDPEKERLQALLEAEKRRSQDLALTLRIREELDPLLRDLPDSDRTPAGKKSKKKARGRRKS